jgi:hypothetical protein
MYLYNFTETSSITVKIHVYEFDDILSNYQDLRTERNLVLDFDKAMPGFTLLRIYDVREWNKHSLIQQLHHTCIYITLQKRLPLLLKINEYISICISILYIND